MPVVALRYLHIGRPQSRVRVAWPNRRLGKKTKFKLEINRKGHWQISHAQLAGLSAETFLAVSAAAQAFLFVFRLISNLNKKSLWKSHA